MELKTSSSRDYRAVRPSNECPRCRKTICLPEWSGSLDARRMRHLWECEACGYKFETLVCFPE
jgi:transcription elongation factor Elf1